MNALCDQFKNTKLQQPPPWLLPEVKVIVKIAMLKTGANHLERDIIEKERFLGVVQNCSCDMKHSC